MKKVIIGMFTVAVLAMSASALSIEGLGYDNGIAIQMPIGKAAKLVASLNGNKSTHTTNGSGDDISVLGYGIQGKFLHPLKTFNKLTIYKMVGATYNNTTKSVTEKAVGVTDTKIMEIGGFAGLQPELVIWDHLSVGFPFGLKLGYISTKKEYDPDDVSLANGKSTDTDINYTLYGTDIGITGSAIFMLQF